MANECYFHLKVVGKKESVKEFLKVLQAKYSYHEDCFSFDRHFYRIFKTNVEEEGVLEDSYFATVSGSCAWSVNHSMRDGKFSCYGIFGKDKANSRGTNLVLESKNLDLKVEIFSEEEGFSFQEHYLYETGVLLKEECADVTMINYDDWDSLEEINEEFKTDFKEEDFKDGFIQFGGFDDWGCFSI